MNLFFGLMVQKNGPGRGEFRVPAQFRAEVCLQTWAYRL